jgi:poly-gamma-glutamate synthesis protein (capsule biosynthesis protein)
MSYSRTRSHRRARRRARRLLFLNLLLLAAVLAAGGLLAANWPSGGAKPSAETAGSHPPGGASAAAVDEPPARPSADRAAAGTADDASASVGIGAEDVSAGIGAAVEPAGTKPPGVSDGEDGPSVRLAFVGDILPASRVAELMAKLGTDYPFRGAKRLLESADIAAGNLETPITKRGSPAQNKQYVFKGTPDALPAMKEAGFDLLSLANNHTLDQGWEGLQDTMDYLDEAGIRHVGAGIDDKDAFTPAYFDANGLSVAFIGVSRVVPEVSWKADRRHPGIADAYDPRRAVEAIREAKSRADLVVVMIHWGIERQDQPDPRYQRKLGSTLIDAGADLVIGSHPHVLQGFESYKGKWIAHSLGNFVFTTTGNPATQQTGVLIAECRKGGACKLQFHPMLAERSQPVPMEPADAEALLARLSKLSFGAVVDANGNVEAVSGRR